MHSVQEQGLALALLCNVTPHPLPPCRGLGLRVDTGSGEYLVAYRFIGRPHAQPLCQENGLARTLPSQNHFAHLWSVMRCPPAEAVRQETVSGIASLEKILRPGRLPGALLGEMRPYLCEG
jgi:hypothetical protein